MEIRIYWWWGWRVFFYVHIDFLLVTFCIHFFLRTLCFYFLFYFKKIFAPSCISTKFIYTSNHTESNSRRNLIFRFIVVFWQKRGGATKKNMFYHNWFFFFSVGLQYRNISIKSEQPSCSNKIISMANKRQLDFLLVQRSPKRLYLKNSTIGHIFIHEF